MLTRAVGYCDNCDNPIEAAEKWVQWRHSSGHLVTLCENCAPRGENVIDHPRK